MIGERYKQFLISFIFLLGLFLFPHCDKSKQQNLIPNVHVNISLDINSTMYTGLNVVGGYEYITGGYRGIVVYRMAYDEFVAYDRACPYDHHENSDARVDVEDNGLTLIDSVCMSRFLLLDGSVVKGPAERPLKSYRTQLDGDNLLIFN
ncbi:MAG: Rieske (2Fe-2S) protein [Bacteroidales bacterium]